MNLLINRPSAVVQGDDIEQVLQFSEDKIIIIFRKFAALILDISSM